MHKILALWAVPRSTSTAFEWMMRQRAASGPVFSKDFPHYIDHLWNDDLLSHFNHSFLIRDPAKTISSMYANQRDIRSGAAALRAYACTSPAWRSLSTEIGLMSSTAADQIYSVECRPIHARNQGLHCKTCAL